MTFKELLNAAALMAEPDETICVEAEYWSNDTDGRVIVKIYSTKYAKHYQANRPEDALALFGKRALGGSTVESLGEIPAVPVNPEPLAPAPDPAPSETCRGMAGADYPF